MEYYIELFIIIIFAVYSILKSRSEKKEIPDFEAGKNIPPFEKFPESNGKKTQIEISTINKKIKKNEKDTILFRQNRRTFPDEFQKPSTNMEAIQGNKIDTMHDQNNLKRQYFFNQIGDKYSPRRAAFIYAEIFSKKKYF